MVAKALILLLVLALAVAGMFASRARSRRAERQRLETRPDVWSQYQRELIRRRRAS